MTRKQTKRLEMILGKLEALQNEVRDSDIRDRLGSGKNELLRALSLADRDGSA
jgi:hypothetical protein